MVTFLAVLYTLICEGFIVGILMDDDETPYASKIIMILFAVIVAPTFFGITIGRIIMSRQHK
jgi:hypothetical protein